MEDDIATLSTGIRLDSLLHIEVFHDSSTDMRQSLLEGNVRVAAYQGTPGVSTDGTPPVIGLSCYIPHLVRHYLRHHIHEQSSNGYEFPDGELLTGLMKYIVAKLTFIKHTCCVCDYEIAFPDPIASFIPKPCNQNLCQALHEAWLVVAPRMELEQFTVECWLNAMFKEDDFLDEKRMLQYMNEKEDWVRGLNYSKKLLMVVKWLQTKIDGSWVKLVTYTRIKSDEELNYRARLLALAKKFELKDSVAKKTSEFRKGSRFRREVEGRLPSGTGLHPYKTGYIFPHTYLG